MTIRIVNGANNRDLNEFFGSHEFKCKGDRCGCKVSVLDERLLDKLTTLRRLIGRPLLITSGYRCPKHNTLSRGIGLSYHLSGQAADIALPGGKDSHDASDMLFYVKALFPFHYLGNGFVHVDIRE